MDRLLQLKQLLKEALRQVELREEEAMSRHTSFRIGGPVTLMALPKTREETLTLLACSREAGVTPFFLGKGSNLLVSDQGFRGFVIKTASPGASVWQEEDGTLYAQGGLSLSQAAVFAMEQGLCGLEFAHGIPGTLGGAVYMNAGAYEGEMSQVVLEVDCVDLSGHCECLPAEALDFGYRNSIFSDGQRLILGARLGLQPGNPQEIREKMMDLMERRRSKQPLDLPSGGSTFKRPPGHFAGSLIEQCGLKGARVGGAQVSEKHAGFVVNTGGASCDDVLRLMALVQERVLEAHGVRLEPELQLLGFERQED